GSTSMDINPVAYPVIVDATAVNYHGQSTTIKVIYVPVDPLLRNKPQTVDIKLVRPDPAQNFYTVVFPANFPAPNGVVTSVTHKYALTFSFWRSSTTTFT